MSGVADDQKFCLEFADFTGELTWLLEKAEAIEDAMGEQLAGAFLWHSVVAEPDIDGFRVFFEVDPAGPGLDRSVPEKLIGIIREIVMSDPPGDQELAA